MKLAGWGEYTEDHLSALRWSGDLDLDNDGYPVQPPHNGAGGFDHAISNSITQPARVYGCRHCGADITFRNRLPHNTNGTPHRCLEDAARKAKDQP